MREPLKDVARNLDRWVHGIVARVFAQATVEDLARWSSVPVINALSDAYHPCQALADMQTIRERFGELQGLKLAFVGDGNNVAHSLMLTALRLGMDFALALPGRLRRRIPTWWRRPKDWPRSRARRSLITHDPAAGAGWRARRLHRRVGQHGPGAGSRQAQARRSANYQVNDELFALARPGAVFMHCLPAKRGEEVTDSIMEHRRSVVFDQAENRLHAQKALLLMLLAEPRS